MVDRPRFGLEEPAYRDYVARHILGLKPGMRLADIGCGSAASSLTLAPYILPGGRIFGFDRDPGGVENARRNADAVGLSEMAEFAEGDATAIPVEPASFDVTACQTVLMHVPSPEAVIAEMARVTVAGGLVAATEPDFSTSVVSHLNGARRSPEDAALWAGAMARVFDGGRLRRAGDWGIGSRLVLPFRDAGLRGVRARSVPASWMVMPGPDGRSADARRWALELFYPQEDSAVFVMQRENHAAAGGDPAEWVALTELRRRELAAILGSDEGASAILHVHTSAYLTVGRVPEGKPDAG